MNCYNKNRFFWRIPPFLFCFLLVYILVNAQELPYRLVFIKCNLLNDDDVSRVQDIMRRSQAAGYTGIVLSDFKFGLLGEQPPIYFKNVEIVRTTARVLRLSIYPLVSGLGHASQILSYDPNLTEGMPVKDAVFDVHNKQGILKQTPKAILRNGDFEKVEGNRFTGWNFQDSPGQRTFVDSHVKHRGSKSLRMGGSIEPRIIKENNWSINQRVKVEPFHQYHVSVWIKTKDFLSTSRNVRFLVIRPSGEEMAFTLWNANKDQGWERYHAVFNSQDNSELTLSFGVRGHKMRGSIWWDDAQLEAVGLLNIVRRLGCPLTVKSVNGFLYEEGKDFEPVKDTYIDKYKIRYNIFHSFPDIHLTPNSRIMDGERLYVSFYHAMVLGSGQVAACLSDPKVDKIIRKQLEAINRLFVPEGIFLSYDELRVANWDDSCLSRKLTPGQLLADQVRRYISLVRGINPKTKIFIWSDMFDPHMNAVDHYFSVNGSLVGSWDGLPKDVIIANWNLRKESCAKSVDWFAKNGYKQILVGYQDQSPRMICQWLSEGKGKHSVVGVMYTTWKDNYYDLEHFAKYIWEAKISGK